MFVLFPECLIECAIIETEGLGLRFCFINSQA